MKLFELVNHIIYDYNQSKHLPYHNKIHTFGSVYPTALRLVRPEGFSLEEQELKLAIQLALVYLDYTK